MANLGVMQNWMLVVLNNMLDQTQVTTLLNKADSEECENWTWARLRARTTINSFAALTMPSVSVTQGTTIVTSNSGLFPPVTTQFVFRVSGQTYSPLNVVANAAQSSTLTLANPYPAASVVNGTGVLFPIYYSLPGWTEVTAVKQQLNLKQTTLEQIDDVDPWLSMVASPALQWAPAGMDASDNVQIMLWPIETAANAYVVQGLRGHVDMVNSTDLPAIPSNVIVAKALADACETLFTLRGDAVWSDMRNYYRQVYESELSKALERDRNEYGVINQVRDALGVSPGLDIIPFRDSSEWE